MPQVAGPSRKRVSRIEVSDSEDEAPAPVNRGKRRKTTPEDESDLDAFDSEEERKTKPQIKRRPNGASNGHVNGHVNAANGMHGAVDAEDEAEAEDDNMEDIAGESAVVAFRPEYQRDPKDRYVIYTANFTILHAELQLCGRVCHSHQV